MDVVTARAQELYDRYRVGHYSYGDRERYDPLLLKFLQQTKAGTLYDIGCGSGYWMETYHQNGIERDKLFGVDLSPTNIEELKSRGFNAIWGDAHDLPVDDQAADCTICNGVLPHVRDPEKVFQELVRITKPGGLIYLAVYNRWNPYYFLVHTMTRPLRYYYWNVNRNILDVLLPLARVLMQPFAFLIFGRLLDETTLKTIFMDQVMTPRTHRCTKESIERVCRAANCELLEARYIKLFLMIGAIVRRR